MNLQYKIFALLLATLILNSCKKESTVEFSDIPVIESYLRDGEYFKLKVTRQIPFSSEVTYSDDDINNLIITVTSNNQIYVLNPVGDGTYVDSNLIVSADQYYNLNFTFNDKEVKAYTYIPSKPTNATQSASEIQIQRLTTTGSAGPSGGGGSPSSGGGPPSGGFGSSESIKITWDNTDNSYYLIVVENVESVLDPIRDFGEDGPPPNLFRKQPSSSSSEEIRTIEFQYYGKHRIIINHVLPDYAALYNESSTSSQNLTNPSTSITNGYGIFTGISSDTLWVTVKE